MQRRTSRHSRRAGLGFLEALEDYGLGVRLMASQLRFGSFLSEHFGDEIVNILSRLPRAEFDPRVVALGGREDLVRRILELKVNTTSLGLSGPIGALRAVSKVKRLIAKDGADVLHAYGSW